MFFCHAQEEIIFNDININTSEIEVKKTVKGIAFGIDPVRFLPGSYYNNLWGSIETHLGFFHENRISNRWTLNKSIGITNAFYRVEKRIFDEHSYGASYGDTEYNYEFSLHASLDPRWYFNQVKRYMNNKSTYNNSGWFLSFPLKISSGLFYSDRLWHPRGITLNVIMPPTIGYRNAFHRNLFFEACLGYFPGVLRYHTYEGVGFLWDSNSSGSGSFSISNFDAGIKIAYTF